MTAMTDQTRPGADRADARDALPSSPFSIAHCSLLIAHCSLLIAHHDDEYPPPLNQPLSGCYQS